MPEQEKVRLEYCPSPKCKLRSLFWNQTNQLWECLNPKCRCTYTSEELSEYRNKRQPNQSISKPATRERKTQQILFTAPLWLVNILESKRFWKLLICSAVIWWCWMAIQYSGNSIGLAIALTIPILLLYAVRVILRKFLAGYSGLASQHRISRIFYSIRKSSFLRFAIILATIALLVTTIWSMISLINNLIESASPIYLLNMLVLIIAQIWLLSWLCGLLKHSRQLSSKPKFAIVFWSLFAVAVFCALVGISPFSDIKTSVANWWEQITVTETPTETATGPPAQNLQPPPDPYSSTLYDVNKDKNPNWVWIDDYTYVAGGKNQAIELYENPSAQNPTWEQLSSFLRTDDTDKISYIPDSFICADFAETLHNNAEKSGIRCGFVTLYLTEKRHACNAFETIDKGLVFIDCTKAENQFGPYEQDKTVNVQVGEDYIPTFIFPNQFGNITWTTLDMGMVNRFQICWQAGTVMDYQYNYTVASAPPYIPPSTSHYYTTTYTPPSEPVCRSCCEKWCSQYQGAWRNGCIDDCTKGGTEKWSWK